MQNLMWHDEKIENYLWMIISNLCTFKIYAGCFFLKRPHFLFHFLVCSVGYWELHLIKLANNRVMVVESNGV